jgi:hypothetical protein
MKRCYSSLASLLLLGSARRAGLQLPLVVDDASLLSPQKISSSPPGAALSEEYMMDFVIFTTEP